MSEHLLDNAAWHAILGRQGELAERRGLAARFLPDVSPLAALAEPTEEALTDLAALLSPGDVAAVVSDASSLPDVEDLDRHTAITCFQMVCQERPREPAPHFDTLGPSDADDMVALARATEPGPFERNTIAMGTYFGVREGGRLIAMAGERLKPEGWIEVSGVCTLPEARGKGLASGLVVAVTHLAADAGCAAFLHVVEGSPSMETALAVYERCGFETRTKIYVHPLMRKPSAA
jgi:predicted GNAT family acetyltransferase